MKGIIPLFIIVCLAIENCATAQPTRQDDLARFNGTWKPIQMILAGQDTAEDVMSPMTLVLKDGTFEFSSRDEFQKGTFTVDTSTRPMQLNIVTENDGQRIEIEGIYRFEEGKMIICYNTSGNRPEKFESTAENGFLLITYQRQKDGQRP